MAVDPERLLYPLPFSQPRVSTPKVLYGSLAILTVAIGELGLVPASPLRQALESRIDIHLLFGLLLCMLVITRYRWCVGRSPRMTAVGIKALSRQLSRVVYLMLYGVIGVRELVALQNSISRGNAFDFSLFDGHFRNGLNGTVFNPRDDAQVFLACGVLALLFVRALALHLWLTAHRRAAQGA
jgi:cytochrome b561